MTSLVCPLRRVPPRRPVLLNPLRRGARERDRDRDRFLVRDRVRPILCGRDVDNTTG